MFSVIFPGQGSQTVGMAMELYNKFEIVKKIFKSVDDVLGYSLSNIVFNGSTSDLNLTKNTQPAIMTVGYSIYTILKNEFNINLNSGRFFAGHSLGEYTALVCAKSLELETAAYLLHERGKAMQDAVPVNKGLMLAILGLNIDDVIKEIGLVSFNGVCEIANDNCPGQVVVSGNKETIHELENILKKKSIRSIILPVSAPFHCSLMKNAAKNMSEKIYNSKFNKPEPSIISNVTAKPENNVEQIRELLVKQITSMVKWRESINYMIENGTTEFIEIGPGKILSGLIKRINRKVKISNINSFTDMKNYKTND